MIYRGTNRDVEQCVSNVETTLQEMIDFLIPEDCLSEWSEKQMERFRRQVDGELSTILDLYQEKLTESADNQSEIDTKNKEISSLEDQIAELRSRIIDLEHELAPWRMLNI